MSGSQATHVIVWHDSALGLDSYWTGDPECNERFGFGDLGDAHCIGDEQQALMTLEMLDLGEAIKRDCQVKPATIAVG
jgi:hypothetical protein